MQANRTGDRDVTAPSSLLETRRLGRRIDGRWLWRGVDLRVGGGTTVAVVGPTGSGKTLLLRCLAALDAADEGTIVAEGRELADWDVPSFRARIVYVHQRPALWEGSVEANLQRVFRLGRHRGRHYDRDGALEQLRRLDRPDNFLDKAADELSGGEAQIVALLRALSIEPAVLLLDEPSASMDAAATRHVEELVRDWAAAAAGRAVVLTSHDAGQVSRIADATFELHETKR